MSIELPGTSYAASLTEDVSRMDIYNRLLKDRIAVSYTHLTLPTNREV